MTVFDLPDFRDHEQVVFASDAETGLKSIIAIHNTRRGPALGGCRIWPYENDGDVVMDALRLSRVMTYKSALAGLALGGGKAVIIADPRSEKTPALLRAFGRAVDQLAGRYITAEDVGTTVPDLEFVRLETPHVVGISEGGAGDPSPATAYGVFVGLQAAARRALGTPSLEGVRVGIQGLGAVGFGLAELLREAGARLTVADLRDSAVERAMRELDADPSDATRIHAADVDVYAPCALGGVLNDDTILEIRARVVAGSANNQLAEDRHGADLQARGILYAPDYAINAGGIINIGHESTRNAGRPYDRQRAFADVARIGDTLERIFDLADQEGVTTAIAADRLAEQRLLEDCPAAA